MVGNNNYQIIFHALGQYSYISIFKILFIVYLNYLYYNYINKYINIILIVQLLQDILCKYTIYNGCIITIFTYVNK